MNKLSLFFIKQGLLHKFYFYNIFKNLENLKPIGIDNGNEILLQTTPKDISSLNDSPPIVNSAIIHSAENNIVTPKREARGIFNS